MSWYVLVPLLSCVFCAVLAAVLYVRDPREPANRLAAALMACTSFWALCEVLWNQQDDPATVLLLVKLGVLGWAPLGAVALHLFIALSNEPWPRLRRVLPVAYLATGLAIVTEFVTPWFHTQAERRSWGWVFDFGPAYGPFFAFMASSVVAGFWVGWHSLRQSSSEADRSQGRWISVAVMVPLVVASTTDALLPMLGYDVPRFGIASLAFLGAVILWSFQRYGYFLLAPGTFAHEILATLPEGVALLNVDGRVRTGNARIAGMLGVRVDELPGRLLAERLSAPLPELIEGDQECELVLADGKALTVAVAARTLRDRQGLEIGTVVVLRDLSELVSLRERVVIAGRLAAVGELAAGIAHEINNPLAFVRANLSLLRQHWDSVESEIQKAGEVREETALVLAEGEELLDESLEGVDRATRIVRDVRGLAHAGGCERQVASLDALLEGVLRIAGPQLRGRITVERDLQGDCPVWCAPQELQQVFLNLVLNAAQAIDDRGRIEVKTRRENETVVASIEDDGCGIDPEIRDRIFDPFFTTKGVGEGTGLGLGIAYGIVRQHGGDVYVESEPGRGTRFSVRLPVATDTLTGS